MNDLLQANIILDKVHDDIVRLAEIDSEFPDRNQSGDGTQSNIKYLQASQITDCSKFKHSQNLVYIDLYAEL